ncbi:hypothetical protein NpPPO83_00006684 [Neofusicoccum parvum]|uniref:Uncharacterized protein n=1 Tax=Neofusicoccum parvum TaxID=310453 RepID=A0ACB5SDL6_9PEZI|nr:hypothetical protein NpPPO83_00006684 [Neofusicoccum parvum]
MPPKRRATQSSPPRPWPARAQPVLQHHQGYHGPHGPTEIPGNYVHPGAPATASFVQQTLVPASGEHSTRPSPHLTTQKFLADSDVEGDQGAAQGDTATENLYSIPVPVSHSPPPRRADTSAPPNTSQQEHLHRVLTASSKAIIQLANGISSAGRAIMDVWISCNIRAMHPPLDEFFWRMHNRVWHLISALYVRAAEMVIAAEVAAKGFHTTG